MPTTRSFAAGALAALAVACASAFTGCTTSRTLLALDNGFEKTRLPVHRDGDRHEDERYLSVSMGGRQQDAFAFKDNNSVPVAVRNNRYAADASLLFEADIFHYGLQLGASPADKGLFRFGGYWGLQAAVTPGFMASLTTGFFANSSANRVRYAHSDAFFFLPMPTEEDSVHGSITRLEIPLRANLILGAGSGISPFVSYSFNRIGIGVRKAGAIVQGHELAAGALVDLPRGFGISVEGAVSRDGVIDRAATEGSRSTGVLLGLYVAAAQRF